jgi:hypothetical protein
MTIKAVSKPQQIALDFEPGLTENHPTLLDFMASRIYQKGLSNVAPILNKAPGNLGLELGGDDKRHFSVKSLERYIEKCQDVTPIYYLIEKYLSDPQAKRDAAQAEMLEIFRQMQPTLKRAGLIR